MVLIIFTYLLLMIINTLKSLSQIIKGCINKRFCEHSSQYCLRCWYWTGWCYRKNRSSGLHGGDGVREAKGVHVSSLMDSTLAVDMPEEERFLPQDKLAVPLLRGFSLTDAIYRHNAPSDAWLLTFLQLVCTVSCLPVSVKHRCCWKKHCFCLKYKPT
jgi:hypothetical protein